MVTKSSRLSTVLILGTYAFRPSMPRSRGDLRPWPYLTENRRVTFEGAHITTYVSL